MDFKYFCNYGFILNVLDWDGDELDVLFYSFEIFIFGVVVNVCIIGVMKMNDLGEIDIKLIVVYDDDYCLVNINSLKELLEFFLLDIEIFFNNYKNWKKLNLIKVLGFEDEKWVFVELEECKELMDKYGKMFKKEFVVKMMKEYFEKYIF